MTTVSGPLRLVTGVPAGTVDEVWVRADRLRPSRGGLTLEGEDRADWNRQTGEVSFEAENGAAVLRIVAGGETADTVGLWIPDQDTATLAQCLDAAGLADAGTQDTLTQLAQRVAADAARVGTATQVEAWASDAQEAVARIGSAEQVETWASRAETAASDAQGIVSDLPTTVATEINTQIPQAVSTEIDTQLPGKLDPELDTRVPPKVAEAIAADRAVAEAAAAAAGPAVEEAADAIKWDNGGVAAGVSIDSLIGNASSGFWSTSLSTPGIPISSPGFVEIAYNGATGRTLQVFQPDSPTASGKWERTHQGGSWSSWKPKQWYMGEIRTGSVDDLESLGSWSIINGNMAGLPAPVTGYIEVKLSLSSTLPDKIQQFTSNENAPREWIRRKGTEGWGGWSPKGHHQLPMTFAPSEESKPQSEIMVAQTHDRKFGFNFATNMLRITRDEGGTWEDLKNFSGSMVESVMPLANGEILVTRMGAGAYRTVTVSDGFVSDPFTAEWVDVLQGAAPEVKFPNWSLSSYENMVFVSEYGPKAGASWNTVELVEEGQNARYLHMSLDYGRTWSTIFDLNEWLLSQGDSIPNHHLHGVAWDPYWDRVWVTFGDRMGGDGSNGILYSDDLGGSWQVANYHRPGDSAPFQVVGIAPMEHAILFTDDNTDPSGPMRISRAGGKHRSTWRVEKAFVYPRGGKHLCHQIVQYRTESGQEVTLMAYGSEGVAARPYLLATRDGFTFTVLWEDREDLAPGLGLRSVAGPTLTGRLHLVNSDGRVAGNATHVLGATSLEGRPAGTELPVDPNVVKSIVDIGGKSDKGHTHTVAQITDLHHYSGTGFPEGKVAAPVGATYTDTAATMGAIRWIKTSGTGATGWRVEYGDTGWRDVTSMYVATDPITLGAGAKLMIRRENNTVIFRISGPATATAAYGNILDIWNGWRPPVDTSVPISGNVTIRHSRYYIRIEGMTAGSDVVVANRSAEVRWAVDVSEPWPSTLPGLPA